MTSKRGMAGVVLPGLMILLAMPLTACQDASSPRSQDSSADPSGGKRDGNSEEATDATRMGTAGLGGGTPGTAGAPGRDAAASTDALAQADGPSAGDEPAARPLDSASGNPVVEPGEFTATADMIAARESHSATSLPSGMVLIVGGEVTFGGSRYSINTTEIYDPASGTFAAGPGMFTSRAFHTATLLADGRVLVAGGYYDSRSLSSAEIYDPATGEFSMSLIEMTAARDGHTATLLPSGKVLLAGGQSRLPPYEAPLANAELFDPTTQSCAATGSMLEPRLQATATRLSNGKVLLAGGSNEHGLVAVAELYDSVTGTFTATGSLLTPRAQHCAVPLSDGRVLIVGGTNTFGYSGSSLTSAEIFDPATETFTATGAMVSARALFTATLLPTSKVLVAGDDGAAGQTAEVYDPRNGTFALTSAMKSKRGGHTATLLPSGNVLLAGGWFFAPGIPGGIFVSSAELFSL